GKHNALQKLVYFSLPILGILAVLTGLAVWKPVSLAPLTDLFGGYVWARYWHFVVMLALVALSVGHVFMVFAVDPQSLRAMTTGGYDESRSPEALNARPFLRGRRPQAFKIRRAAEPPAETSPAAPVPVAAGDIVDSGDADLAEDRGPARAEAEARAAGADAEEEG
ncbi:MAG TPA: cytochrome b/b6 domain-containing protein, partial [Pyrinomonadaceae bacterium]